MSGAPLGLAWLVALALSPDDAAMQDTPDERMLVADFLLEAAGGERVGLYAEDPARQLTVLAFTSTGCPITKLLAPRLGRLEKEYRDRGVRFLGIDPNIQDDAGEVRQFAAGAGMDFPILLDPAQVVTDRLGVERTTEVFVLDAGFRIVYRGAVDDQYTVGAAKPAPTNDYLIDALESELAGETIDTARTDAPGCLIGRVKGSAAAGELTFHQDVAPILYRNCVECHRAGQIGPMGLLDYADAAGWAPTIAEVVEAGRMPPWHADPRFGHFKNARRLTETEKAIVTRWAGQGAKEGDARDAPARPIFADAEWLIGTPDLVVELPEEQAVPAEGVLPYRYAVVDPKLTEDRWVQCVEVKPGNRAVTHHVISFVVPPGMSPRQVLTDPEGALGSAHFAGNVPGGRPIELPDGYGKFLKAGSKFYFQLHYTPNGTATTDRTRMALRFSRVPVTHEVKARAVVFGGLNIPPNDPDATFHSSYTFREAGTLTGMMPHMHVRGRSFRFELERHGGDRSILLDVPHYDFNWQHTYLLADPLELDPGDQLHITASFDNSKDNPANPDPNQRVRWGDQTFEEMMVGYLGYVKEVTPKAATPQGSE